MRLIDADALMKQAYWKGEVPTNDNLYADGCEVVNAADIEDAPTIDAEPVRHGRWEFKHPNGWACSECGEWGLMIDNRGICKSNYCPNCGAKMDLEADTNN